MKTLILTLASGLLLLSGCSTRCEAVCAEANTCTLAQREHRVDCYNFCFNVSQFEQRAKAAGADACATEFDAHLTCWQTNKAQLCTPKSEVCLQSSTAWTDCLAKFCADEANIKDPACVDYGEDGVYPSFSGF